MSKKHKALLVALITAAAAALASLGLIDQETLNTLLSSQEAP